MKRLRTIEIGGRAIQVCLATSDQHPNLLDPPDAGAYHPSLAQILIVPGPSHEVLVDTYLHEILHACLDISGIEPSLRALRKGLEERLVSALTPVLRSALVSAGWREPKSLKAPRRKKAPK